jgi:hypothetical protein
MPPSLRIGRTFFRVEGVRLLYLSTDQTAVKLTEDGFLWQMKRFP